MVDLSSHIQAVLLAYGAFLLGIASPGPNVLSVMSTSMGDGRRSGMALAFGVSLGSLTWAALTAMGLTTLLAAHVWALSLLKLAGGLYLLWLACKAFRSAARADPIEMSPVNGSRRSIVGYVWRGYSVMMTNPKAILAWVAIMSVGLQPGAPIWVAAAIIGGTFALSMAIHLLYALAFSSGPMIRMYARARRKIEVTLGVFFAFVGLKLLLSRP
jgi:amino acid exporter